MDIKLHKQHQSVQGSHWWFRVKDNILKDLAEKYFKVGDSVLDFGCNYGHSVKMLKDLGFSAAGVDVSEEAINFGNSIIKAIAHCIFFTPVRVPFLILLCKIVIFFSFPDHVFNQ